MISEKRMSMTVKPADQQAENHVTIDAKVTIPQVVSVGKQIDPEGLSRYMGLRTRRGIISELDTALEEYADGMPL